MRLLIRSKKGESLIEILVSIALISIITIVFLRAVTTIVVLNKKNSERLDGEFIAQRYSEYLTQHEGVTIGNLQSTLNNETEFECTQLSFSDPFRFRIEDDDYPEMYAIISIDYRKFTSKGNLSLVKITVYATEDDTKLSYMENALYWS